MLTVKMEEGYMVVSAWDPSLEGKSGGGVARLYG